MDDRFLRARELFDELRALPDPTARAAYLDEHAAEDPALRAEVQALLDRHVALGGDHESEPDPAMRGAAEAAWEYASGQPDAAPALRHLGRYSIVGVLGQGGMATVYRARQEEPRREVALKVLHPGTWDTAGLARFRQEAALLARLRHEGIAQVYEFDEATTPEGSRHFIAMELIDGADLLEHADHAGLSVEARVELILQVLDAVGDAHRQGIIHRDLKPANVLVNERGRTKLLDFGVARTQEDEGALTRTGDVIGTLLYMSPEQVRGSLVDTRADLYAIGLCAFELFSGRRAREVEGGPTAMLEAIVRGSVPPLARVAPKLPLDLCLIVDKALSDEPDRRYATADAFADDLQRFLKSETVAARPPTLTYQLSRFVRRHRPLVVATLLTILALATGLTLSLRSGAEARRERAKADQLAAERLRDISIVRVQNALDHLASGQPGLAAGILAKIPDEHRTYAWHLAHAMLDDRVHYLKTHALRDSRVATPDEIGVRVYTLDESGRLHSTDERRTRQPSRIEAQRIVKQAGVQAPSLVRCPDGHLLDLRPDRFEGSKAWPSEALPFLPARPGTEALSAYIRHSSLRLRKPGATTESLPRVQVNRPDCFALHPSLPLLLVGGRDADLALADLRDRSVLWRSRPHFAEVSAVTWTRDGRAFASIDAMGTLLVHDASSRVQTIALRSAAREVEDLQWASDGRTLVGLGADGLHTWRPYDAAPSVLRHHARTWPNYVYSVTTSPDGRRVASGAWDRTVRLSSSITGELLATLDTGDDAVTSVVFALDGRRLVVGCTDAIYLFDADTGQQLGRWPRGRSYRRLALAPSGDEITWRAGAEGRVESLDLKRRPLEPRVVLQGLPDGLNAREQGDWKYEAGFAYGPNGDTFIQRAMTCDWVQRRLDTGEIEQRVSSPGTDPDAGVADLLVHPDGRRLIAAGPGTRVSVYDLHEGSLLASLVGHTEQVFSVALHPEGRFLASASNDRSVRLRDLEGGGESVVLSGHTSYVHDVAFSPDGRTLYSASGDGSVRIWSTIPRRERQDALVAERARMRRLDPLVARLLEDHREARSALEAVNSPGFEGTEAERLTLRDLILRAFAGR